jgi:hypothetical protein
VEICVAFCLAPLVAANAISEFSIKDNVLYDTAEPPPQRQWQKFGIIRCSVIYAIRNRPEPY